MSFSGKTFIRPADRGKFVQCLGLYILTTPLLGYRQHDFTRKPIYTQLEIQNIVLSQQPNI